VRAAARLVRVDVVQRAFLVTVNQSTRELEEELQGFRSILFAGIPLMLLPAVAGGWILASRSLAPVIDMAARVERISSENLHERLPPVPANDELGKLTGTFNRLLERLEGAFEQPARAEYAYRDALTTIERQMARLSRIVRDLFLMARADGGRLEIEQRPYHFDEVIDGAARAARVMAHKKGVELLTGPVPEACGHGDDGLIRQLLLILLENAVKFTPTGGRISIESSFAGESIVIRVKDTGCGIAPEHQPHIFERFFRGSGTESGAGLGLSIGHWIATAHHGSVELLASSARGSVFGVRLPASPAIEPR
jgi:signal transduction histidine kinase